jgi:hypothetical protein
MSHVLFFLQGEGKPGVGLQVSGIFLDGATSLLPAFFFANTRSTLRVSCRCYGGLAEKQTQALLSGLEGLVLALLWRQHRVSRLACSIHTDAADWRGHHIPHSALAVVRCDEGLRVAHALSLMMKWSLELGADIGFRARGAELQELRGARVRLNSVVSAFTQAYAGGKKMK